MKVSVIGTGYVGLVSGVCLAEKGHDVVCVDVDPAKVERIKRAEPPIHEQGLEALLRRKPVAGISARPPIWRRRCTDGSFDDRGRHAVQRRGNRSDLHSAAARQIGAALKDKPSYHVVIVKSTVVPGTTETWCCPRSSTPPARKRARILASA